MGANKNLNSAKSAKNDEFYTRLEDIENELRHYKGHFEGKVLYCNCDDPEWSNFYKYFKSNFNHFGLKKLITTHYTKNAAVDKAYKMECILDTDGSLKETKTILTGDGDFRSEECIALLKEVDIVCTNPPFSLFKAYVAQLIEMNKRLIVIGSLNALTYKEIFKLIKDNCIWLGHGFNGGNAYFTTPHTKGFAKGVYDESTGLVKFRNVTWFTNLDIKKRQEKLVLYKTYAGNAGEYPQYDNCNAINVDKIKNIPVDYNGAMGVPISFLAHHNPNQFEILGLDDIGNQWRGKGPSLNGKTVYRRVIIRRIITSKDE